MHFDPYEVYHVYNRGNNKQPIFFQERNYWYFLKKISAEWKKYCEILSYCLMPNHFHFMILPNELACQQIILADKETALQNLSKQIGITLSSYTKAINNQNVTSGVLFQKKTKAKCLNNAHNLPAQKQNSLDYIATCFDYIHQNPLKAGIVENLKNWPFSSWQDYAGFRKGRLCNQEKLFQLTGLTIKDCIDQNIILNEKSF